VPSEICPSRHRRHAARLAELARPVADCGLAAVGVYAPIGHRPDQPVRVDVGPIAGLAAQAAARLAIASAADDRTWPAAAETDTADRDRQAAQRAVVAAAEAITAQLPDPDRPAAVGAWLPCSDAAHAAHQALCDCADDVVLAGLAHEHGVGVDEMLDELCDQQAQTGLLTSQAAAGCPDPSRAARLALTAAAAFCKAAHADEIDLPDLAG
jgi:hypothetical protein